MRDKQIEEMGEYIAEAAYSKCAIVTSCDRCKWHDSTNQKADCLDYLIAEALYNAGYRKASDIFEEIQKSIVHNILHNENYSFEGVMDSITKDLDELKKKYESEEIK